MLIHNITVVVCMVRLWCVWCGCGVYGAVVVCMVRLWCVWCGCGVYGAVVVCMVRLWYVWCCCGVYGAVVVCMVLLWCIWCSCGAYGAVVVRMVRLWCVWCGCGTYGAVVVRMVRLWCVWCGCGAYGAVAEKTFVHIVEIGIHKFAEVAFGLFRKRSRVHVKRCRLDIEAKQMAKPCYSFCYTSESSVVDGSGDVFGCEISLSSAGKGDISIL